MVVAVDWQDCGSPSLLSFRAAVGLAMSLHLWRFFCNWCGRSFNTDPSSWGPKPWTHSLHTMLHDKSFYRILSPRNFSIRNCIIDDNQCSRLLEDGFWCGALSREYLTIVSSSLILSCLSKPFHRWSNNASTSNLVFPSSNVRDRGTMVNRYSVILLRSWLYALHWYLIVQLSPVSEDSRVRSS